MGTDMIVSVCSDLYIEEKQRNPMKKEEDASQTSVSELNQNEAATFSFVAKNVALSDHVLLDDEDGVQPQIDCSFVFVLIGPILNCLNDPNLIIQNLIV